MPPIDECKYCGGSLHPKTVPYYDYQWQGKTYRFENLPALVCACCGEAYLEADTTQAMDKFLATNPKPKRFVEFAVFDLSFFTTHKSRVTGPITRREIYDHL